MFIAALILIVENWTQPRCPSTRKRTNHLKYNHMMEYNSAIKLHELPIRTAKRVNLRNTTLSKRAHAELFHAKF